MTEAELATIEARAKRIAASDWDDPICYDREQFPPDLALALVAEVRRLRDRVFRVEHDFEQLDGNRVRCRDCGLED